MISGDVVTNVKAYLADVIANVVAVVVATVFDFCGRCCANYWCTIDIVVAEGIVVPVADVIATSRL